jgi:drug/metabolite transporter (DMT)-like permease
MPGGAAATIHLDTPSPGASSGLPAGSGEQPSNTCATTPQCGLLDLASGGVYLAVPVTQNAGALLPHRFTLTTARVAVCFLWHFPASHLGLPLTITLLCEVRTFLDSPTRAAAAQPTRPRGSPYPLRNAQTSAQQAASYLTWSQYLGIGLTTVLVLPNTRTRRGGGLVAKADIAAVLALAAALFIAISDAVQQRLAYDASDERVGAIALFTRLLRNPRWWLGSLIAAVGFTLQAAALGVGSVVLVQALFVTSLLFALPISAKLSHRKVTRAEWTWAAMLAASVAVIVTVGNPQLGHSRAPLQTWIVVGAVIGPALMLCLVGARIWSGPVRAVLLGLVSGSLWGVFTVLTKGVVDQLGDGIWAVLHTPELYAWLLVGFAATMWQQSSFQAGVLTASLPTLTVAEPVVGSALGVLVLGERLDTNDIGRFALVSAVAATVVATTALARDAATSTQKPDHTSSKVRINHS